MKNGLKLTITIISFALLASFIYGGYQLENKQKSEFRKQNEKVASFLDTTDTRIASTVITLPDGSTIVGLNNYTGTYNYESSSGNISGKVQLEGQLMKVNFIPGIYKVRGPRLDAIIPMQVSADSHGSSTYIVLFNDRGDTALEKSYARLGDNSISIQSINTLPADTNVVGENYKVDILYKDTATSKELIVPVVDGQFDPSLTILK